MELEAYRLFDSDKADVFKRMQVGVELSLETPLKVEQSTSLATVLLSDDEDNEDEDEEEFMSLDIIIST